MKAHFPARPAFFCVLAAACFVVTCKRKPMPPGETCSLSAMKQVAQRFIHFQSGKLADQLAAFSKVVVADRDFSMKLLVENNRSAPEVTDFTLRYMEPMGFSLLEITDSQHVLLSCGQFPASAGTSIAEKAARLSDQAQFVNDMVKGQPALTLQMEKRFKILDSVLYCSGGILVDERFIAALPLANGYKAIIRQGGVVIGSGAHESVSARTDSTITINDTTYRAATIALPFSGGGDTAVLVVVDERLAAQKP